MAFAAHPVIAAWPKPGPRQPNPSAWLIESSALPPIRTMLCSLNAFAVARRPPSRQPATRRARTAVIPSRADRLPPLRLLHQLGLMKSSGNHHA
jgi:hypothetical protein